MSRRLPARGTVCQSDYTPFTELLEDEESVESAAARITPKRNPVVVAPTKPGMR